jgi:hypothetical protein
MVERVNDLHYGERYVTATVLEHSLMCRRFLYVDYIILDALRDSNLQRVAFTYDIYCKYNINAEARALKHFPPEMLNRFLAMSKRGFIPKLHIYGHGARCMTKWSLNYGRGVGRTDGESTERDWAAAVLAAQQTSEMNPGSRHAALNDHWIDKNFRRLVGLSIACHSSLISSLLTHRQCTFYSNGLNWHENGLVSTATL